MDAHLLEEKHDSGILYRRQHILDGKLHCTDGPAKEVFYRNGAVDSREWYLHGKSHRANGPAYERYHVNESSKRTLAEYWINGERLTRAEHRRRVALLKLTTQTFDAGGVSL